MDENNCPTFQINLRKSEKKAFICNFFFYEGKSTQKYHDILAMLGHLSTYRYKLCSVLRYLGN